LPHAGYFAWRAAVGRAQDRTRRRILCRAAPGQGGRENGDHRRLVDAAGNGAGEIVRDPWFSWRRAHLWRTVFRLELKEFDESVRARLSASESIDEVPHFVVEISRVVQRLCDLGAGNFPKAATQAMDGDFQRAFTETELGGSVSLRGA
jgi:hypothetical protein